MDSDTREVLDEKECAELLRQKIRTLGYWRQRHIGPKAYHSGRKIIYFRGEVLEWLRDNLVTD